MRRVLLACSLCLCLVSGALADDRWEGAIRQFETQDRTNAPPKGAVLFVGSSTIVGWNLPKSFPNLVTINRGFGGSEIADSLRYADRIIVPYSPRAIVLYAGDNDLAAGKSPETVARDFRQFVERVRAKLPDVPILFLAIKPSIARWGLNDKIRDANGRIEAFCKSQKGLTFVAVEPSMLGPDGKPNAALFQADGLHLNERGYELYSKSVLPHLVPQQE